MTSRKLTKINHALNWFSLLSSTQTLTLTSRKPSCSDLPIPGDLTRHPNSIHVSSLSHPTRHVVTSRRESRPSFFLSPLRPRAPPPAAARHAWPTAVAVAAGAHRPSPFSFPFSLFPFSFLSLPPSFLPPLPRSRSPEPRQAGSLPSLPAPSPACPGPPWPRRRPPAHVPLTPRAHPHALAAPRHTERRTLAAAHARARPAPRPPPPRHARCPAARAPALRRLAARARCTKAAAGAAPAPRTPLAPAPLARTRRTALAPARHDAAA